MAISFTYSKYKDVHSVKNDDLVSIQYSLIRNECDSATVVNTGTITVGETITLPVTYADGNYKVVITKGEEEDSFDFSTFNNLLKAFITNVEASLCGCKTCNDCEDCDDCNLYLTTVNQALAYYAVNNPTYNSYVNTINEELKCLYREAILCTLTSKMVNGEDDIKEIYFQMIAMYYLAFYLYDLGQAADSAEAEYVKTKYNSAKIIKCIRKLGVDVEELTDLFLGDMLVYYWQLTNTSDDINDIIPIFDLNYLLAKQSVNFEEFEQGKIVSYDTVGRIVFAVRETDLVNFTLLDSLGNDVTDEFDNHYFATERTVLYVSKVPYSISNIYFRFKKITNLP